MNTAQRINGERVVVLGWGRAILMQLAHPLVAAGVAEHSTFDAGRLARVGRLHATVRAMLDLTYGDAHAAARTAAHINAIHDRVNGYLAENAGEYVAGTPYTATDPWLLLWVHATLLDSMPLAYEQFVAPLSSAEKDAYCAESLEGARLLRIPEQIVPITWSALNSYLRQVLSGDQVHVTSAARRVARELLYPPLTDPTRPAAWLVRLVTLGLLPDSIRAAYGFRWTPGHTRAFHVFSRVCRAVRPFVPAMIAQWPQARHQGG